MAVRVVCFEKSYLLPRCCRTIRTALYEVNKLASAAFQLELELCPIGVDLSRPGGSMCLGQAALSPWKTETLHAHSCHCRRSSTDTEMCGNWQYSLVLRLMIQF